MTRFLILLIALTGFFGGDKRAGRKGNALYRQDRYAEAADAYRQGLEALPNREPGVVPAGLLNNLGAALFRQGDFEGARTAFEASSGLSDAPADFGRGAYNAGNAAFRAQQLEESLSLYRRAMLRDPSDDEARFNYEFVRRQLEQQQQQQQQQQNQDQQQQQQDQEQQQQEQQQEQQEQQQDQEQQQEQQQREPEEQQELSEEEAQRMLEALENEEEQLLRQVQKMKARPRRVEKDW